MTKNLPTNLYGPAIRAARLAAGMTQTKLTARINEMGSCHLDRTAISRIEGQARKLKDIEMVAIGQVLGFEWQRVTEDDGKDVG